MKILTKQPTKPNLETGPEFVRSSENGTITAGSVTDGATRPGHDFAPSVTTASRRPVEGTKVHQKGNGLPTHPDLQVGPSNLLCYPGCSTCSSRARWLRAQSRRVRHSRPMTCRTSRTNHPDFPGSLFDNSERNLSCAREPERNTFPPRDWRNLADAFLVRELNVKSLTLLVMPPVFAKWITPASRSLKDDVTLWGSTETSPTRLFVGDTTYGLALVLVVLLVFMNKKSRRPGLRFPPGPPAWPLLGHLPLLGGRPHVRFAEWSRRYGPVLGVRLGPQQVVVLNGYAAVREALVTKAEVFSSRPDLYLMRLFSNGKGGLISDQQKFKVTSDVSVAGRALRLTFAARLVDRAGNGGRTAPSSQVPPLWAEANYNSTDGIGLAPYTAKWRAQRRVTDRALRNLGVGKLSFEPKIMEEVEEFISAAARYEGAAFDPKYHIAVGILNIICHLVFGRRFEHDDPLFVRLYNALEDISHHGGSAQHLNVFPALRHVPGLNAGAVHTVRAVREGRDFVREMIGQHKATFDPENIRDYIDAYLHQLQKETEDGEKKSATYLSDEELEQNVFDLFIAGSESTATTLRWATLLLLVNPEVQERVQQELDAVLGQGQASVLDRASLPYTQATIQEILRYRPSATFSLPHATTADTTLQGYDIPAGTQVLVNVYGMGMDPALWQHPGTFDPTRFLDGEGKLSVPEHFKPFLVGRRACIGSQLAKMQLLLYITTVLQRFSLRLPEGEPPPSLDGSLGVMLQCPSFRMCAVSRQPTC
ncbi:hypothetical protein Bbelb_296580 [Branchiostoma belcheri]|nr:hypothetical protein Bbelb_296580 [Branchiostoma belcheri]